MNRSGAPPGAGAARPPARARGSVGADADAVLTHLGALPVATFLRRDWQRRPRLIRQAVPLSGPPLSRAALFALAAREDVASRLVRHDAAARWRLLQGPFGRGRLPGLGRAGWTLLVQGTDQHDAGAARLLRRFRFLPDARLDDLMISYATDGGGVGPHIDSYDVFLLQAAGRRRWRIARHPDPTLVADLPLKILRHFTPEQSWDLEPGDLLYLPPGVAHDGVALGESITCSIGFRAPRWAELVEPWSAALAERAAPAGAYRDRGTRPTRHPGRLPPALVQAAFAALTRRPPRRADAQRMLLATLSEPPAHHVFDRPARPLDARRFAAAACRRGVALDLRSRLLYAGTWIGINGEALAAPGAAGARRLAELADRRGLDAGRLESDDTVLLALLHDWYRAGWLALQPG
jgi:50S ribosomal protein L16 3-hydroxylase